MATYVRINEGTYRNTPIKGVIFPLVAEFRKTPKKQFVTVNGNCMGFVEKIRITVAGVESYDVVTEESFLAQGNVINPNNDSITSKKTAVSSAVAVAVEVIPAIPAETDADMDIRIRESFEVLDLMTKAAIASEIRAMIVTGPPGVGKSYGVEQELDKTVMFDDIAGKDKRFGFVKGMVTPIALYASLYKYSAKGSVIVLDDCDGALRDEDCLNMLKCALDSGKKRRISWMSSRSTYLEDEGIPDSFDFKGSAVFITNLDFTANRSKKMGAHLDALMSRCHYLDLSMNTMKEKFMRIRQVSETGKLFDDYNFNNETEAEILNFMFENKDYLREVSLRMCLKIADLRRMSKFKWKKLAASTCMFKMPRGAMAY